MPPISSAATVLAGLRFSEPEPAAIAAPPPAPPAAPPAPPADPPAEAAAPPAEALVDDLTTLRRFSEVAPDLRMPHSRQEWQALPELVRLQLAAQLPAWAESFADPDALPARLSLAVKSGQFDGLDRHDLTALESAGFVATAERLRQESWEAKVGHVDAGAIFGQPVDHAALQAQLEADRQASLADHQQRTQRATLLRARAGA